MTPILELVDVSVRFRGPRRSLLGRRADVVAVADVSLSVADGETVGIVGESGSGKSTLARTVVGLVAPTTGRVEFDGRPVDPGRPLGRDVQMVFQDPFGSVNPRFDVHRIVAEPLRNHEPDRRGAALDARVTELLDAVRLPRSVAHRRAGALSGGQLQRVGIARALALSPRLLVADEPVSALDVSVQAQILNLLDELREERGISCLFIGHNLAVVEHVSDRIAVMFAGRIVELAPSAAVVTSAAHPYSRALLAAVPLFGVVGRVAADDGGATSSAAPASTGCPYAPRCPHAVARCTAEVPPLRVLRPGHLVACHRAEELASSAPSKNAVPVEAGTL
jgi:oligopeptide/dipeptide ABC transporter ATP-binding protein